MRISDWSSDVFSSDLPYRAKHPNVRFTILSCTSIRTLSMLENLEVDAGITYIDNEPLGKARSVPLYSEQYRLLTSEDSPLGDRESVRSEARSVGKECVRTCRFCGSPYP